MPIVMYFFSFTIVVVYDKGAKSHVAHPIFVLAAELCKPYSIEQCTHSPIVWMGTINRNRIPFSTPASTKFVIYLTDRMRGGLSDILDKRTISIDQCRIIDDGLLAPAVICYFDYYM